MRKVLIPIELNIDKLLASHPPTFPQFKKDHLLILMGIMLDIPAIKRDLVDNNGFVRLKSTILKKYVRNYKDYLIYLKKHNIIEIDNQYIKEKKSRGYKFSTGLETDLIEFDLESVKINYNKLVREFTWEDAKRTNKRKYLLRWLTDSKLSIKYEEAKEYLKQELKKELNSTPREARNNYRLKLVNLTRIKNQDIYYTVDPTSERLHSNLTNLKSELRQFLTYNYKPLISLDLTNSQPYLSTLILKPSFYQPRTPINLSKLGIQSIPISQLQELQEALPIMLGKLENSPRDLGIKKYIEKVTSGTLYEYFAEKAREHLGIEYASRKDAKIAMFMVLFTDNRFIGQEEAAFKRLFRDLFPGVYQVFNRIKKGQKNRLSIILQRIESYLFLDVICKDISKINPNIPIFTIHDSIATTEDYYQTVLNQMENTLKAYVGHVPKLKIEYWDQTYG